MKVYVYEDHLSGERYASDEFVSYEDRFCETCGDSDCLIDEGEPEDILLSARHGLRNKIAEYRELQEILRPFMKEVKRK